MGTLEGTRGRHDSFNCGDVGVVSIASPVVVVTSVKDANTLYDMYVKGIC